jgi:hypothetical protein
MLNRGYQVWEHNETRVIGVDDEASTAVNCIHQHFADQASFTFISISDFIAGKENVNRNVFSLTIFVC